jgi:Lrp/AsnC family transcriptional regulator, regulator of ectoine-degradation genes
VQRDEKVPTGGAPDALQLLSGNATTGDGTMAIPKRRRSKPDALDLRILAALHREGRISKTKLSAEVGLSATRCWERMRRMEDEGIIRGYHADISLRRLADLSLFMVQIKLTESSVANGQRFEKLVAGFPEIIGCEDVLGPIDYFLVIAASGVEAYQKVIENLAVQGSVRFEYITFPIAKTLKTPFSVPLAALLSRCS